MSTSFFASIIPSNSDPLCTGFRFAIKTKTGSGQWGKHGSVFGNRPTLEDCIFLINCLNDAPWQRVQEGVIPPESVRISV